MYSKVFDSSHAGSWAESHYAAQHRWNHNDFKRHISRNDLIFKFTSTVIKQAKINTAE